MWDRKTEWKKGIGHQTLWPLCFSYQQIQVTQRGGGGGGGAMG
jgi:hypothetical protein